jgi:hypothetical protein
MKIDLVERVMEAIGRPCDTGEIVQYMLDNKLCEPVHWDLKMEISRKLAALKKWEIADRLPQGHHGNRGHLWYLTRNGEPEHDPKTCQYCKNRTKTFNHYMTGLRMESTKRHVRKTHDNKDQDFEDRW